jgi:tetratricopeptide (TPR) repeat protein
MKNSSSLSRFILIPLFTLCILSLFSFCRADIIHLKNGRAIEGAILKQDEKIIEIRLHSGAVLEYPMENVEHIESESKKDRFYKEARYFIRAKQYDKAVEVLDNAVPSYKTEKDYIQLREKAYGLDLKVKIKESRELLDRGQLKKGCDLIRDIWERAPEGRARMDAEKWLADAYLKGAKDEINRISYTAAQNILAEGIRAGIDDARFHLLVADIHQRRGKYLFAESEYELALEIEPNLAEAKSGLAMSKRKIEMYGLRKLELIDKDQDMIALRKKVEEKTIATKPTAELKKEDISSYLDIISADEYARISKYISPYSRRYDSLVNSAAAKYRVDPSWIKAIIMAESSFRPGIQSRVGARGLMQLMDETASDMGVDDPLDPGQNIMGGTRYFRRMLNMFSDDPVMALAAYNAGPGTVSMYNGVPPYKETESYIQKVMLYYQYFKYEQANTG